MTTSDPSQDTPRPEKGLESPPAARKEPREPACIICGQRWCDCGKGPEHFDEFID